MRDKKKGNRILICGIALSICLFVLAGGVILHLSETFIRSGIADMAGAVGIAAPEQLGGVMHLYKSGDGLKDAGEEILRQYGYGRGVYSFAPAWLGAAAYAIPFGMLLIMLFSFGLYWRHRTKEAEMRTAALSGYLDRIMEGQYDTLMQHDTGSELEDSIYKAVVLLREEREQAQRAKKNLADNMADLSHQLKTPAASIGLTLSLLKKKAWDEETKEDIGRMEGQVSRLQQLVGSMLTLSRLDVGVRNWKKKSLTWRKCWWMQSSPLSGRWKKRGYALGYRALTGFRFPGISDGAARRSAISLKTAWSIRRSGGISVLSAVTILSIRKSLFRTAEGDLTRQTFPACLSGSTGAQVLPKTVQESGLPWQNPSLRKKTGRSRQKIQRQGAQDSILNFTIVTELAHKGGSM